MRMRGAQQEDEKKGGEAPNFKDDHGKALLLNGTAVGTAGELDVVMPLEGPLPPHPDCAPPPPPTPLHPWRPPPPGTPSSSARRLTCASP
mmetsp:Transcript_30526/g.91174  ORF Transcript_30526/g.91174 Transcript_30526/m.91174 type:complete len:90 (+) Transcript_30526:1442-1711(+)